MRAVQLDFANPEFPASLIEVDAPRLPGAAWARVQVTAGGICGSDLHLFTHNTGPSPTLVGFVELPCLLGHEIAGRVTEVGPDCDVAVGTRVAVQPTIVCEARGIDPPCPPCARGDISSCQNLDSGVTTPGMCLGFTRGLGGGWADQVVAHRSMLFPIPDGVADRAASLHEPVSIAAHGLLRQPPGPGEPVAVVGCGIIGLAAIAALRTFFPDNPVTALARHAHQGEAAAACGAAHVVWSSAEGAGHIDELGRISGTRAVGGRRNRMLAAGFPYVVEAVGTTSSVNEALRIADNRGTVLLLGAAGRAEYDLTPVWWKELALVGAINHSVDPGPLGAPPRHSVARALDILAAGALPHEVVVTHEFGLEEYHQAIETAIDRRSGAIKVVFRP
jgi:threonine dehydrogenase-like Zn-dependent dehydrogenase